MKVKTRIIGECFGISRQEIIDHKGSSYYAVTGFREGSCAISINIILTWNYTQ